VQVKDESAKQPAMKMMCCSSFESRKRALTYIKRVSKEGEFGAVDYPLLFNMIFCYVKRIFFLYFLKILTPSVGRNFQSQQENPQSQYKLLYRCYTFLSFYSVRYDLEIVDSLLDLSPLGSVEPL